MELKLERTLPTTLPPPLQLKQFTTNVVVFSLSLYPNRNDPPLHFLRRVKAGYRRWDSNAENFRAQNFSFNPQDDDEDEEEENGGDWLAVFEEFIDGAWIFPVFRSFGWMLPAIISSLLVTTGPKAFLMALAIPLGQSALSLAFQKIFGGKSKRKRKDSKQKKSRSRYTRNVKMEEDNDDDKAAESEETIKGTRTGYQTWAASNDGRVDNDGRRSPNFGGWDELDRRRSKASSARKSAQNADGQVQSKLSRSRGKSETPLLMRLLIAVFPFLGSWTKFF